MISNKIKTLFEFIDYLHSNINTFKSYSKLIKEIEQLKSHKKLLNPDVNYQDKMKYNDIQKNLESKFEILQENTSNKIKAKAKELNLCNFDNEPNYSFNGIEAEIQQLKENFSKDDLPEIFKHKQQYIDYRTKTHKTFLSLSFFIEELDEITKSLFDYFKETEQNEFEAFETKAIQVNSITEAVQGFKQGQTKFVLPTTMNKTTNRILNKLADFNFFQIEVVEDLEFEGKTYKDIKQRNNDSILTPENWEKNKDVFFTQRMETYNDSYTLTEKIKLELLGLEKLPLNTTDYKILKDRYKGYLEQKETLPPQPINNETDTEKYTAKHYLLTYLFECNAKGVSYPIGNKKELERIGNERMGSGKGNRFYKVFNEVINIDLNVEKNLFEIGGEYWRKAVIKLSKDPELVENYLQSKQL